MRVMLGREGDCFVLVLKSIGWPWNCVLFFQQVTCADKFPNRKSFVVAAILLGSHGGRMALCMEDPASWSAAREDYQYQCETWLCNFGNPDRG